MLNRYLGQLGQDRTVVKFLLNYYGPNGNEDFDDLGVMMNSGSVQVKMPFSNGVIESIVYQQYSDFDLTNYQFRLWMFNNTITSAVRGQQKAFTSSEMDSFVGTFEIRTQAAFPPVTDTWVYGFDEVPYNNMLQKKINIPFVLDQENPMLHFAQEYTGSGITLYRVYIYCYLIIKRD